MDQERADYDDQPGRRRRPWTVLEIAIAIVIVLLSAPLVAFALVATALLLAIGWGHK